MQPSVISAVAELLVYLLTMSLLSPSLTVAVWPCHAHHHFVNKSH